MSFWPNAPQRLVLRGARVALYVTSLGIAADGLFTTRMSVSAGDQAALPPAATVRLTPADALRLSREGRQSVSVQMADGLELTLWASSQLVADAIAMDIDSRGAMYVTASPRSGQLLDIRQHAGWVPEVHTLKSVEDLRQFFQRVLAPERSAENTWLPDFNRDGSRDWRDLTVIKERIYRLQDTSGLGVADLSQVVYEGFNKDVASDIAGGVLLYGNDLYVSAAPDLWKLRDVNGDGVFDTAESISHGYSIHPTFSGHDLSGGLRRSSRYGGCATPALLAFWGTRRNQSSPRPHVPSVTRAASMQPFRRWAACSTTRALRANRSCAARSVPTFALEPSRRPIGWRHSPADPCHRAR